MTDIPYLVQDADIQSIWDTDLHALGCVSCGIAHLVPAVSEPKRCPACLTENLESQPARLRPEPPELIIPFSQSLTAVNLSAGLTRWLRGIWLRPQDLRVERLLPRLQRVYLPMWLVDGQVVGIWGARMGFDYQVESTQERFTEGGGWTSRRLRETRTRWEPRVGRIKRTYQNLKVPALEETEERAVMAHLGRYELDQAVAFSPATIADAAVRVPSLLPDEAWPLGQFAFDRYAAADCQRASGAQHSEEFSLLADYQDLNWTQLLLPFFIAFYEDDTGRLVPVWVNGQTGHIGGKRLASLRKGWRVSAAAAAAAFIGFLVGALLTLLNAPGVASLLMTISFFLILLATLPVIWAWQFNQRQRRENRA